MKKLAALITAIMLCMTLAQAGPVDVNVAQLVGKQFVAYTFDNLRQDPDLQLVYTGVADRGEACFYVFNVDDRGFVIVSADDRFRPITGYSDEGVFVTENMSPELDFYLGKIIEARTSPDAVLYEDAAAEWKSLLQGGQPFSRNRGKGIPYLVQTKWNQDYPYNLYAPEANGGPGGHCYAGCVATAMSQVMRFWNHPIQGQGSHGYYSNYGHLSANFGATTYDWDHMPLRISSGSPQVEIEAVALFMFHCGVSVNMGFSPTGSGAYSDDVPYAILHYFGYTGDAENLYRNSYTLTGWKNLLKEQFNLGWPVYYSGYSDTGGHAFVCDGYDDNDLFHYNWGWGGSNDGWFVIDEIDYANWAAAVVNYVPDNIYEHMPMGPDDLTVEPQGDPDCTAELTWTNPTTTIHGDPLGTIDKVVVCRNGEPIHTFLNPEVGQAMSFTDHFLPVTVTYSVYAIANEAKSVVATSDPMVLGPTCPWTVTMTSSNPQGWRASQIVVTDGRGTQLAVLKPNSASQTRTLDMPLGAVRFSWQRTGSEEDQVHFEIKNGSQTVMTSFDGLSKDLKNGLFYKADNNCMNGGTLDAPANLSALTRDDGVLLNWDMVSEPGCSYFIYRDHRLYDIASEASYLDAANDGEFHSYYITAYNGVIESDPSNYCNVQSASDCLSPTNLRYTLLSPTKILLKWDAPQASGVSGYKVYRRHANEEFIRIKATSTTSCEITLSTLPCEFYDLTVSAYYSADHCESSFASTRADATLNFVELNNTIIPIQVTADVNEDGVRLAWLTAIMAESYTIYRNGTLLAEGVTESTYLDTTAEVGQDYSYTVVGKNSMLVSNPSNTVRVDWATMDVNEANTATQVSVYPNPAHDQIVVKAQGMRRLVVLNLMGQVVMSQDVEEEMSVLDLSSLKQGAYFLQVYGDSENTTVRFVKM